MGKPKLYTKKPNMFTNAEKKTVLFWFDIFYVVASSVLFLFVPVTSQNAFTTFQIGAVMPILLAINASIGVSVYKDKQSTIIPPQG